MSSENGTDNGSSVADDGQGAGAPTRAGQDSVDEELTEQELQLIKELSARDQEVRAHERAHQSAAGGLAGSASYTYQSGPDGKRYAIGGEVPIDASPVPGNPEATIAKMRVVRAAALAPAEPSPQDRSVAAAASQSLAQAQAELAALRASEEASEEVSQKEEKNLQRVSSSSGASRYQQVEAYAGSKESGSAVDLTV